MAALIILIVAVIVPIYFTVIKKNNKSTGAAAPAHTTGSGGGGNPGNSSNPNNPHTLITGGDGSLVTTSDGSTFTYVNKFGGFWYDDPKDPFNDNAQPNSWTPPLNTTWDWSKDKVYGVNLGGWFVIEPFITPYLFEKYVNQSINVVDEWTLSQAMAADTAGGGLQQLEDHYNTFITEQDIAEIAGAGLNWIRVPIPFWAIDKWDGEPFLDKVCWKYILRLFGWARKYGLRVNLDLHTIPGSQNGYNHSGKSGQIDFMNGVMGMANAQRTLDYIRIITEFISQPQYAHVVPMFGIINEVLFTTIGKDQITSFYLQVHEMIRGITGIGEGHGPYISIHEGFQGVASFAGFLPNSDRIALDVHPYFAFGGGSGSDPISSYSTMACGWGPDMNTSQTAFGVTAAGEFSNGFNDCGLYLTGVGNSHTYTGDCSKWQDASTWDQSTKDDLKTFAMASMDALQNWFFWTWKVGNSSTTNSVQSPLWSYKLGLENGWMPTDPRAALGTCQGLGAGGGTPFNGQYESWQTGGAGAGSIAAASTAQFPWPPTSIAGAGDPATLPTYTPTGTVSTLPPPTVTAPATAAAINGWFDAQDTALAYTTVAGCKYPDAWNALDVAVPPVCTGTGAKRAALPEPAITSLPMARAAVKRT
ncbi:glycoside hydrolase [Rickenella mellea]|uniref:glucan 1,3-beta-glucosidase n=1 Tax=Rickenella mellea TaxID=50990 RepID=A0A4Y7Q6L4_9AGAM|nr:glycoside hydrolase [Rickenella mellea]